ncbi:MAG: HupE/UreJ family protein [Kofleriaceae bacterium]
MRRPGLWAILATLAISAPAWAHKPSDAHVQLAIANDQVTGTIAIALRDLDGALDLDANGDGSITWREAQVAAPRIAAYTAERVTLAGDDGTCKLAIGAGKLSDYSDGAYWSMPVTGHCAGDTLSLTYNVLFDIDAQHRGIVQVRTPRGSSTTVVRDAKPLSLTVGDGGTIGGALAGAGFAITSLAVLACLLLLVAPALAQRGRNPQREADRRPALAPRDREPALAQHDRQPALAKHDRHLGAATAGSRGSARARGFVSACFARLRALTRAGSRTADLRASIGAFVLGSAAITLVATAGWLALPAHLVTIASIASVAIAAASNLIRRTAARYDLAFELGLLHGTAGSFALATLAPHHRTTVFAFVAGAALAQIAIAAVLALVLYTARSLLAKRTVVWAVSGASAVAAVVWAIVIA